MSSTKIPRRILTALWVKAGGRCEFVGCNTLLWRDDITSLEINRGFVAHIVADSPEGPRGDPVRSPQLATSLSNLMLLCHEHHRLIDCEVKYEYTEVILLQMKASHELRIESVTKVGPDLRTQIVVYRAPIGDERPPNEISKIRAAVRERYPTSMPLELDVSIYPMTDRQDEFWSISRRTLELHFEHRLRYQLQDSGQHLSVFALAPIPLLAAFGKLLGDKAEADIYQRHRKPAGWAWPTNEITLSYQMSPVDGDPLSGDVAVVLSISDTVQYADVRAVCPIGTPVYEIRIDDPRRDCVRSVCDVRAFGETWQRLQNSIRAHHRERTPVIHVFAAIPNSLAVELGRSLLAKSHSELLVYDYNRNLGGFRLAFPL